MNSRGPKLPLDWCLLINGKGDEMLYERGFLRTGRQPFEEMKCRALIDPVVKEAFTAGGFSQRIRAGRPGFAAGS